MWDFLWLQCDLCSSIRCEVWDTCENSNLISGVICDVYLCVKFGIPTCEWYVIFYICVEYNFVKLVKIENLNLWKELLYMIFVWNIVLWDSLKNLEAYLVNGNVIFIICVEYNFVSIVRRWEIHICEKC